MRVGLSALPPDAELIREKAREVLARDEFDVGDYTDQDQRLLGQSAEFLRWMWEKLNEFSQLLAGLPAPFRWLLYAVLTALLVLLIWHIGYTMVRGMRVPERAPHDSKGGRSRDPRELERLAEAAFGRDEYIEAVRLLFRAAILRLENAEHRTNRPGMTNRELLRRYRSTPLHAALRQLVDVIDTTWYGGRECGLEDYEFCREAHDNVRAQARRVLPPAPGTRSSPPVPTAS